MTTPPLCGEQLTITEYILHTYRVRINAGKMVGRNLKKTSHVREYQYLLHDPSARVGGYSVQCAEPNHQSQCYTRRPQPNSFAKRYNNPDNIYSLPNSNQPLAVNANLVKSTLRLTNSTSSISDTSDASSSLFGTRRSSLPWTLTSRTILTEGPVAAAAVTATP
jgi:hypothetical protein